LAPVTRTALSAIVIVRLIGLLPCFVSAQPRTFEDAEKSHRLRVHVRFGGHSRLRRASS